MKSIHRQGIGGNVKMRGKLTKILSCKCCDMVNFKPQERVKEAKKEIKEYAG